MNNPRATENNLREENRQLREANPELRRILGCILRLVKGQDVFHSRIEKVDKEGEALNLK